jgi:hypothetical protein
MWAIERISIYRPKASTYDIWLLGCSLSVLGLSSIRHWTLNVDEYMCISGWAGCCGIDTAGTRKI